MYVLLFSITYLLMPARSYKIPHGKTETYPRGSMTRCPAGSRKTKLRSNGAIDCTGRTPKPRAPAKKAPAKKAPAKNALPYKKRAAVRKTVAQAFGPGKEVASGGVGRVAEID